MLCQQLVLATHAAYVLERCIGRLAFATRAADTATLFTCFQYKSQVMLGAVDRSLLVLARCVVTCAVLFRLHLENRKWRSATVKYASKQLKRGIIGSCCFLDVVALEKKCSCVKSRHVSSCNQLQIAHSPTGDQAMVPDNSYLAGRIVGSKDVVDDDMMCVNCY